MPEPPQAVAPQLIRWSGMTDRGRVRANNEDAFLALAFDAREVRFLGKHGAATLYDSDFVFAVSDGMGGAKSGEFASRIAVDKITKLLPRSFKQSAQHFVAGFEDILDALFTSIHEELTRLAISYEECAGMGATLSLGWFTPGWMYFAHIGDSRIYYLPVEGGITQVSHDDSYVGWLRREGKINEREARSHPRKNVLSKALGAGHRYVDPHVGAVGCQSGDRFLFCTDGVIDGLWDRTLDELARSAPPEGCSTAEWVVATAVEESGRDNATAVVIEVQETDQPGTNPNES